MLASLKRVFPRLFLLSAGAALPVATLLLGARVLGLAPLNEGEKGGIANYQHLNFDDIEPLCRQGRKFHGGRNQIVTFGASSVEGAEATYERDFSTLLQLRLQKRFPYEWTVHNLARSAKTSFWIKRCMEISAKDPAKFWIAYEGHNDFIDIYGGGVTKTNFLLAHPWSYRLLQWLLDSSASGWLRPFISTGAPAKNWAQLDADVRRVLAISEANYREMISTAQRSGVKLVLATVISNLAWEPSPAKLEGAPDGLDAPTAFKRASDAFAAKRFDEALSFYRLARDRDVNMWRAPSSFNELMRRLAAEFPGDVLLLDLERDFEKEFGREQIGCKFFGSDSYCDQLHPNDFTHAWIMRKIEQLLFPEGGK